ncbi:MAG TPA: AMP-binding protein [Caldimonas sp.]|nr:AMP-binding protein [Caldimonas sp.]
MATTVFEWVERQAAARPAAVYAIATEDKQSIAYGDLRDSCRDIGAGLAALGLAPGDTVSVVMPNGLQTLRILLGTMHAGCCVNPVNLLSQPEQMRYVLDHSDCRLVVASPEWAERVRAALVGVERGVRVVVLAADGGANALRDALPAATARVDRRPPAPDSIALLMYTSGTTGVPKGVMLTQANLAANAASISREHDLGVGDRVLAVLPLYHINAFAVTMLAPLAHGGSLAMAPKFSAAQFWSQAVEQRCTWLNVVPTIISYLLEGPSPPRESLHRIRFCRSASAALPPEHHRAFEAKFGIGIVETMGLTETVAPAFSNPLERQHRKIGSVGRASGGEARVVDKLSVPVADGSTGELVVRGAHVMRGYYKNDVATRDSFTADGWLRTGDLGHRDADGFFFVTGRIKELIIKGGENIAPREIDEALLRHPAVLEAAAVGMPDAQYGQEIMACVVLKPGEHCALDELYAFSQRELGKYKTPKLIKLVDSLPKGPSGKVQRLKLLQAD